MVSGGKPHSLAWDETVLFGFAIRKCESRVLVGEKHRDTAGMEVHDRFLTRSVIDAEYARAIIL